MTPRRKPPAKATPPPADQLSMPYDKAAPPEHHVYPHALRPGDVYRDVTGAEWTVLHVPTVYRQGKRFSVKVRLVSDPRVERVEDLAAHEKVRVRRPVAG